MYSVHPMQPINFVFLGCCFACAARRTRGRVFLRAVRWMHKSRCGVAVTRDAKFPSCSRIGDVDNIMMEELIIVSKEKSRSSLRKLDELLNNSVQKDGCREYSVCVCE